MKHALALICLLSVFLFACSPSGPSESDIQTAIHQTEMVRPTDTVAPTATITFTASPTLTQTPTSTATASPTFTPSPTPDLRVIKVEPQNLILVPEDLPKEARFYLPNSGWTSPHHNSEIISGWGRDRGLEYLDRTGRVDGWWVHYSRGTRTVVAPEEMFNNVIMYETAEGAQLTLTNYNMVLRGLPRDGDWEFVENIDLDLGETNNVMQSKEMQSNGKNRIWYRIQFTYRNYLAVVQGYGWDDEVRHEFVEDVARSVLEKLESAPLSSPFSQDA